MIEDFNFGGYVLSAISQLQASKTDSNVYFSAVYPDGLRYFITVSPTSSSYYYMSDSYFIDFPNYIPLSNNYIFIGKCELPVRDKLK